MRFVLVHGGFHGAWCWDLLVPELERHGHEAVAIDLPGHGRKAAQEASLAGYCDAVVEALEPGDVLVGHSLGGFVVSAAADAALDRVQHVVYLAGGLPLEGQPMIAGGAGRLSDQQDKIQLIDDGRRMMFRSDEDAIAFFYHDCPPEIAAWACSMLTPQPLAPMLEPISLTRLWDAELPRSLILCTQDRAGGGADAVAANVERLGVEPLTIDTSHSPFLSRPARCAELVIEATTRAPTRARMLAAAAP